MLQKILGILDEAGEIARRHYNNLEDSQVIHKGETDIVTVADKEIETFLHSRLHDVFPDIDFFGEEGDYGKLDDYDRIFICDPIDGTTSYRHGHPFHSISIGLRENGRTTLGAIHLPYFHETYYALPGQGAFKDGKPIHASRTSTLIDSLVATGTGCVRSHIKPDNVPVMDEFFYKTQGVRIGGSACVDFCFIAEGRYDAYWEFYLKPWDYEAGRLIATEAGAVVTGFDNQPVQDTIGRVVATNGLLHQQVLDIIQKHL